MSERKKTILICDDSILARKKLTECLAAIGDFAIIEATNGEEAVQMYQEHKPDLVMMDIVLPVLDGVEALEAIKNFDRGAKIIMVSSSGTQYNLIKAVKNGALDFIQKPWQEEQVLSVVKKYLVTFSQVPGN